VKISAKQKLSVALGASILGALALGFVAPAAHAAPGIGGIRSHAGDAGQIEKVTYGWHRHCYWRYGYRHCHWGHRHWRGHSYGGYRHWGTRDWRYQHWGSRTHSMY
jgi:hypothetical protein